VTHACQQRSADAGCILEAVEHVAPDGDVTGQSLGLAAPFEGQRLMGAATVLVRLPAIDGVARTEGFALEVDCRDQPMLDRTGGEATLHLR